LKPAPAFLFLYGTLRRGAPMHALVEGRARYVGPAETEGRLVDLGAFPAFVAEAAPGECVKGDLFEIHAGEAETLLDVLDRYEGAKFRRERFRVHGPAGAVDAWLYRFVGDARAARVVEGGDYLAGA
jgi:gamma-glutamylcyclotransferase (GGCT)/AIG2-like uncharacterized protein YtfP